MYKQIVEEFEKYLKISNLSEVTRDRYKYYTTKYLKFVDKNGQNIDLKSVQNFLLDLKVRRKLSEGTINDYRSAIKYLFEAVLEFGWNDRKIPRLKYYTPLPVVLSVNEIKRLFKYTKDNLYLTIFTTMYSSGLRISEARNIKFKNIDNERNTIYIEKGKNGHARYADLSEKNLKQLRKYYKRYWKSKFGKYDKENYVFCTYKPEVPITSKSIRKELKNAAKRAEIKKDITPHTLRHSISVHMLESGVDLISIKRFLGHKSISSTCIYLQMANVKKLGYKNPFDSKF